MKKRRIEKKLTQWQPSDGDYIHLAALLQALPGHRWDLYLVGINASGRMPKTKPLLGRVRINAVVVLLSSMREWLLHYNAERPEVVESTLHDLRQAQAAYLRNLNAIRAEVRAKSGETPGRKATPKVAKATRHVAPKFTSNELLGVWK